MRKSGTFNALTLAVAGLLIVVGSGAAIKSDSLRKGSRTLYVDAYFGDDTYDGLSPFEPFATIQHAIKVARDEDILFVYDGIYRESLDLAGKGLTIRGIAGPLGVPIIEASGPSAVLMATGEGADTILQNLVIRNSPIGICTLDSSPTLRNLTVVDCGIGVVALRQSEPEINSCIFWDNTAGDISGARAQYSCIRQIEEDLLFSNTSGDPLFVDPVNGDYHLRSREGYYQVESDMWITDRYTSPCLNAGDPERDIYQEPSPNGACLNIGAYGGTAYASLNSNLSPTVVITGWGRSSTTLSVSAEAKDVDGRVVKVEFYVDGVKVGEAAYEDEGRWRAEWQPETAGTYAVIAVAEDDQGLRSLSEAREFDFYAGSGGRH